MREHNYDLNEIEFRKKGSGTGESIKILTGHWFDYAHFPDPRKWITSGPVRFDVLIKKWDPLSDKFVFDRVANAEILIDGRNPDRWEWVSIDPTVVKLVAFYIHPDWSIVWQKRFLELG